MPSTIREAGYGVGATKWEVIRSHVLPSAFPGILTGTVLTLARAFGETAPLLVDRRSDRLLLSLVRRDVLDNLTGPYTALPVIVFSWSRQTDPAFAATLAPAAITVLLADPLCPQWRGDLLPKPIRKAMVSRMDDVVTTSTDLVPGAADLDLDAMIAPTGDEADDTHPIIIDVENLNVFYGDFHAVKDVTLPIRQNEITALIGPSGCGKIDGAALFQPDERPGRERPGRRHGRVSRGRPLLEEGRSC